MEVLDFKNQYVPPKHSYGELVEELTTPIDKKIGIITDGKIKYISCNALATAALNVTFVKDAGIMKEFVANADYLVTVPQRNSVRLMSACPVNRVISFVCTLAQYRDKQKLSVEWTRCRDFVRWWKTTPYYISIQPQENTDSAKVGDDLLGALKVEVNFQNTRLPIYQPVHYSAYYLLDYNLADILCCSYTGVDDGGAFANAMKSVLPLNEIQRIRDDSYLNIGHLYSYEKRLCVRLLENETAEFNAQRPQIKHVINWLSKYKDTEPLKDYSYDEKRLWQLCLPENINTKTYRQHFIFGKHGEAVFKRRMEVDGHTLQLPADVLASGASTVDFETTKDGKDEIWFDEVKTRAKAYTYKGKYITFDLKKATFEKYLAYKTKTGKNVFLTFICLENKTAYRAEIEDLTEPFVNLLDEENTKFPVNDKYPDGTECIRFHINQFDFPFALNDDESSYIQSINEAEQAYIDAAPVNDVEEKFPTEEDEGAEVEPVLEIFDGEFVTNVETPFEVTVPVWKVEGKIAVPCSAVGEMFGLKMFHMDTNQLTGKITQKSSVQPFKVRRKEYKPFNAFWAEDVIRWLIYVGVHFGEECISGNYPNYKEVLSWWEKVSFNIHNENIIISNENNQADTPVKLENFSRIEKISATVKNLPDLLEDWKKAVNITPEHLAKISEINNDAADLIKSTTAKTMDNFFKQVFDFYAEVADFKTEWEKTNEQSFCNG